MFYVTCDQGHYIGKHIRQCPVMPVNPTERKHPVDAHRGPRHPQWPKNELMHANLLDLLFIINSQSILFLNKTISCSLKLESMSVCQLACCHLIPVVHEASAQEPTPVASKGWWRCWWRDMSNARHCNITLSQNLRTWLAEASVDPQQQNLVVHVVDAAFSQLRFDQLSSKLIIWQGTHVFVGSLTSTCQQKKMEKTWQSTINQMSCLNATLEAVTKPELSHTQSVFTNWWNKFVWKKSIQGKTEIPLHFSCIRGKSNISDEDNVSLSFWREKHVRWLEIVSPFVICLFSSVPCLTFENTTCFVSFFLVQQQKCIRPSSMGTIWCHFGRNCCGIPWTCDICQTFPLPREHNNTLFEERFWDLKSVACLFSQGVSLLRYF